MSAVYFETSAVLCWLFGESKAPEVIRVINGAETIATSQLTMIEARRAVTRAVHRTLVSVADGRRLEGLLRHECFGWTIMAIDEAIAERAGQPLPAEPVRSLDAIHLATAVEFIAAFPDLTMLSFDTTIRDNCRALGVPLAQ